MKYFVEGHNGIGDSLHQRAAIRAMLERGDEIWLTTATPCMYHDLPKERLHLIDSGTALRTQAKNAARERDRFDMSAVPADCVRLRPRYDGASVKAEGSVLAAMSAAFRVSAASSDFRLSIPEAWRSRAPLPRRPFVLLRPPVARTEWISAAARNPDPVAFAEIFAAVRAGFQIVSVADLEKGREWLVGNAIPADVVYHAGELDLEQLAAMTAAAAWVFTTPGMMTVLAQAVEAPCITVFGGFENAWSFSGGDRYGGWLPIEPTDPCDCWSPYHACDKSIDVPAAIAAARAFVRSLSGSRKAA